MTRSNIENSLDAVETALAHLAEALQQGGFEAGSESYQKMTAIIIGQRVWAADAGMGELDARFANVAKLADRIHNQLQPYCSAMERLRAIEEITLHDADIHPLEQSVLDALDVSTAAMSATELSKVIGEPGAATRKLLNDMAERNIVQKSGRKFAMVKHSVMQRA